MQIKCYLGMLPLLISITSLAQYQEPSKLYLKLKDNITWQLPAYNYEQSVKSSGNYPIPTDILEKSKVQEVKAIAGKLSNAVIDNTYLITYAFQAGDRDILVNDLSTLPFVEYVEKVGLVDPLEARTYRPNDQLYGMDKQWYLYKIQAEEAWNVTKGSASVVIAIIDDGVHYNHIELVNNMWVNNDAIDGIDNDNNGYIDDLLGYDMANNDPDIDHPSYQLPWGHGTHVAGIAGGVTDNGIGFASIGFNVSIMGLKVYKDNNTAVVRSDVVEAIQYAIDNGAHVINISMAFNSFSQTEQNVIDLAYQNNLVVVASAGNDGNNKISYPAKYNNVISVAATTQTDTKEVDSNFNAAMDISAPGKDIWSLFPPDWILVATGTSMASPVVTGIAGLIISVNPSLTVDQIENCITSTADPMLSDTYYNNGQMGGGRVNAFRAVTCALPSGIKSLAHLNHPVSIFPNPANKWMSIELNALGAGNAIIFDVNGEVVADYSLNPGLNKLNTEKLANGLYMLTIYYLDGSQSNRKFNVAH